MGEGREGSGRKGKKTEGSCPYNEFLATPMVLQKKVSN